MFKMCRQLTVPCHYGPAVTQNLNTGLPDIDHRLNGNRHSRLETGNVTFVDEIWDLGFFVKGLSHPVADKLADHAESASFHMLLNGPRYRRYAMSGARLGNPQVERLSRYIHQFLPQRRTSANCHGHGDIPNKAAISDADVQFEQIAKLKWSVITDPMYNALVHRQAALRRKISITQKCADRAMASNQFPHLEVQLPSRDPRADSERSLPQNTGGNFPRLADQGNLGLRLWPLVRHGILRLRRVDCWSDSSRKQWKDLRDFTKNRKANRHMRPLTRPFLRKPS